MNTDDSDDRTVIKPAVRVSNAGQDDNATVIRPAGATRFEGTQAAGAPVPQRQGGADMGNHLAEGTYLGEFEITQLIGEGGFGIVYLATDHSLQRRVALKEYMPSALAARGAGAQVSVKSERHRDTFEAGLKSFVNEARLLAQFDHPSLVKVYRFWEANGTAYMVMPFYEGITLKDQLKKLGAPPDEAQLMEWLSPLSEALEVIHAEQCFHRDIAPDNVILLKGSNRPLLLDFGAARRVIGDMTQALTVILKPGYAPVEQYAEVPGMKQGPWTDVYALAAVVYFAIVGKTPPTSVGRLMNDSYVPLVKAAAGRYTERFLAAIDRALIVKPEERTQSIGDLRHDLGLDTMAAQPRPAAARREAGQQAGGGEAKSGSKTPLIAAAAVGGLVVLGGGLYAWLGSGSKPAPPPVAAASAPATVNAAPPAASSVAQAAPVPQEAASSVAVQPPPPPPPPQAFEPLRDFERVVALQSPDFHVDAATIKPQFRIDKDFLQFSVKAEKDGYLYVFLFGSDGALIQVFPNGMAKSNRMRGGQTLVLPPPKSQEWAMKASGPPGTDHFIAIVSEHPRDFSAIGLQVDSGYAQGTVQGAVEAARRLGGDKPLFLGKATCQAPCTDNFGATLFSSDQIN